MQATFTTETKSNRVMVREIQNPFGYYPEIDEEQWDEGLSKKIQKAALTDEENLSIKELCLEFFDVFRKASTFRLAHHIEGGGGILPGITTSSTSTLRS
jgi:hypothetical protein